MTQRTLGGLEVPASMAEVESLAPRRYQQVRMLYVGRLHNGTQDQS